MELDEIVDTSDTAALVDQYIEVALTSDRAFQISPIPEQFLCTTVFPQEEMHEFRMAQFVRDYREAVTHRWDRVMKFQNMVNGTKKDPVMLWHPLSAQIVCRVGRGFASVDVSQPHLHAVTAHMKSINAWFNGSPSADPLPAGRVQDTVVSITANRGGLNE